MKTKSTKKVSIKKLVLSFVFAVTLLLSLAPACTNLMPSHSASTLICGRMNANDRTGIKSRIA